MIITESYKPSTQVLSTQNNGTAKQKTQAADKQSVQPAYQVDISPTGERTQIEASMEKMFTNIASQATLTSFKWTDDQKEAFNHIMKAAGKSDISKLLNIEDFKASTTEACAAEDLFQGDGVLWFDITIERSLENTGLVNPLHKDYQTVMDKFFTAASAVEQGGVSTFKQLNLEFAGVAFSTNEKDQSSKAAQQIAKGEYTQNEYTTAKNYASQLQNKAGVYVQVGDYESSISYTYNGTIANVGVKQLDFMASHQEAASVWTKAMQGGYKNAHELTDALKDGGFDDAAKGYEKMLSAHTEGKKWTIDNIMQSEFTQECGSLWSAAVGSDKFKEMQTQYSNNKHFTYSASDLGNAYSNGQKEATMIHDAPSARNPSFWYVTDKGQAQDADGIKNTKRARTEAIMPTSSNQPIIALQKELKNLRKQLESLKSGETDQSQGKAQEQTLNTRIQTIQLQISSYLKTISKK